METIEKVAIDYYNIGLVVVLPKPNRHHNIIHYVSEKYGITTLKEPHIQGFWTSNKRFVGREEAAKIALAAGQIKELQWSEVALFSEDLW